MAIRGVQDLQEPWIRVPPGGTLKLSWPLPSDFFARSDSKPATDR
jgi:hypothetical protein